MEDKKIDEGQADGMENEGAPSAELVEKPESAEAEVREDPYVASDKEIVACASQYLDPFEEGIIRIHKESKTVVINSTQVSRDHITNLTKQLNGSGWSIKVVDSNPFETKL